MSIDEWAGRLPRCGEIFAVVFFHAVIVLPHSAVRLVRERTDIAVSLVALFPGSDPLSLVSPLPFDVASIKAAPES